MSDALAVPVDPGQQIQIYFGGQFDQTIMGAPVYFWGMFVMGMMLVCGMILVCYYRFLILDKVWAFVDCYKKRTPLALIRTRYRTAYFKSLTYIAQVFFDEETNDMWTAPALETSSNLEGVNLIECVDYYDWLQDPILNEAIRQLILKWNEKNPGKEIKTPTDFQERLGKGDLVGLFEGEVKQITVSAEKVPVPAFFLVDIAKIEQYLPRTRSSAMLGGVAQKIGSDLGNKEKVDWKSWVIPIAALCTLMIICGIIAGLLGTGKL